MEPLTFVADHRGLDWQGTFTLFRNWWLVCLEEKKYPLHGLNITFCLLLCGEDGAEKKYCGTQRLPDRNC